MAVAGPEPPPRAVGARGSVPLRRDGFSSPPQETPQCCRLHRGAAASGHEIPPSAVARRRRGLQSHQPGRTRAPGPGRLWQRRGTEGTAGDGDRWVRSSVPGRRPHPHRARPSRSGCRGARPRPRPTGKARPAPRATAGHGGIRRGHLVTPRPRYTTASLQSSFRQCHPPPPLPGSARAGAPQQHRRERVPRRGGTGTGALAAPR